MSFFTKPPPILQGEELYTEWMQYTEIWSLFMDLPKEKNRAKQYFCHFLRIYVNEFDIWW